MNQWQCNIEMCIESAWINVEDIPLAWQYMECCQGAMQRLSVLQGLEMYQDKVTEGLQTDGDYVKLKPKHSFGKEWK